MSKRPELMIASGPMSGMRFQVTESGVRLGRSSSNDVHIPDEELSRNHCLFEPDGDAGIRVTDLASANGTLVNGEALGAAPRVLVPGDRIEVGFSTIMVVAEDAPAKAESAKVASARSAVDLGLSSARSPASRASISESSSPSASKGGSSRPRSPIANILWVATALMVAVAIFFILSAPRASEAPVVLTPAVREAPELMGLRYEKVEADATRIYRYQMEIDGKGVLSVKFDDIPDADRHVDKKAKLSEEAMKRVMEIVENPEFAKLEDSYSGSSASDENALKSWRIRVLKFNKIKDVAVENTQEPDAFRAVREALEAFSRNELGIWAIQYSGEKLTQMSKDSMAVGDTKWEDREVEYGNLSASAKAYGEAIFYLDTVNPKPDWYDELKSRLERTEAELKKRYEDQRFLANKAINLADWETAQNELKILCEMVPDKTDPRHSEANSKLVDVENRMKKAKGGK